jgi:bacteriocin biosynthesis cyclodehydratase domain-containing protein
LLPVWRDRDTLQIGIDSRRAVALTGMADAAWVISLLDGSRDRAQVIQVAAEHGIPAETADRVLTLLATAGALDDFPVGTLRLLSQPLRTRLASELATVSLARRDADGGARTLARRLAAQVRVHGGGRVAMNIASLLTTSGIGCVTRAVPPPGKADARSGDNADARRGDEAPPADAERSRTSPRGKTPRGKTPRGKTPGGKTPGGKTPSPNTSPGKTPPGKAASDKTPVSLAPVGMAVAGKKPARKKPAAKKPTAKAPVAAPLPIPDLAILAGRHSLEFRAALMRQRIPHLATSAEEAIGIVGPLVIPGRTACLRCLDLHRTDRDPAWPLILAQLGERESEPPACDAPLAAAVAAHAAAQALAFIDRPAEAAEAGAAVNGTLELVLPTWQWRRRTWPPHPDCNCGGGRR